MLDTILACLRRSDASAWRVNWQHTERAELFFLLRGADMRRAVDTTAATVTVFRDFAEDGKRMRGSSAVHVHPGMTEARVEAAVRAAWEDAACVRNPWFELPDPIRQEDRSPDAFRGEELPSVARRMADSMFSSDVQGDAFLNSAEVFAGRTHTRVLASNGLDVSFTQCLVEGELVAQCVRGEDVEVYRSFRWHTADEAAIAAEAASAIAMARDRSQATEAPAAGTYDCVLSGEQAAALLSAYAWKADAASVYAGYSPCRVGSSLQGEEIRGEHLHIDLTSPVPFSEEGVPLPEMPLARGGILQNLHGSARFCRYLGIAPAGPYRAVRVEGGSLSMEELTKAPCIHPVLFSDFQVDELAGRFGGEIRLAYVHDGNGTRVVTGGSISGSLLEAQKDYAFSKERWSSSRYDGPKAVRLRGVSVAGK